MVGVEAFYRATMSHLPTPDPDVTADAAPDAHAPDAPTGALGSTPSMESESYTHGHHESVLRSHQIGRAHV